MNLAKQIAWERECAERGSEKYYAQQDRLRDSGQGDQTDAVSYLLRDRVQEIADALERESKVVVGKGKKWNKLLRAYVPDGDFLRVAYIGLQHVFQNLPHKRKNTVLQMCLSIAGKVEADCKCRIFESENESYYGTVMKSFTTQKVTDYTHRHKVLMKKFSEFDLKWNDWSPTHKGQFGSIILKAILDACDDVLYVKREWDKGKSTNLIDSTVEFDQWAGDFERERGFMCPEFLPLKIPPRDWTSNSDGGYYTPNMRLPFVKTKGKVHRDWVESNLPKAHIQAVNKMQGTAWQINTKVLEVQKIIYEKGLGIGIPSCEEIKPLPFPPDLADVDKEDYTPLQAQRVTDWKAQAKRAYAKERERKGKVIAFMQSHRLAKELEDWDRFYFAYNADFRGRIYCATAALSPQGADVAKGVLRFAEGVRLGPDGIRWLAVQGANVFGNDKLSYDDRIQWIRDNERLIRSVVEDPISTRDSWGAADKPYQFLAFCFEWAECDYGRNEDAEGHLPVGLDGSCNGLQHFSAMLRDAVGAKATNLSPCDKPEDIYAEVAKVCTEKLKGIDDPRARKWLAVGVNRKCAKRPVMTLPYGATQQSARQYIFDYCVENWDKFNIDEKYQWEFANFLTPLLWESIGEVVIAARAAMNWLRTNTSGTFAKWLTPIGFPVFQYYKKATTVTIRTQLCGNLRMKLQCFEESGEPNSYAQKNGIAPNFIHSIDSTHMVMTILMTDYPALAMIHDDFGTHAGNTQDLFIKIREAFYTLYDNCDPLESWAKQWPRPCSAVPEKGEYNLEEIFNAAYFFG